MATNKFFNLLSGWTTNCSFVEKRKLFFYKEYFREFYLSLTSKTKEKVVWVLDLVEQHERIPKTFFKHIEGTTGLYEIRVTSGLSAYRIFCFFDEGNIVVIGHGFQKKTQKTPLKEIEKALTIKKHYYEEKKSNQPG